MVTTFGGYRPMRFLMLAVAALAATACRTNDERADFVITKLVTATFGGTGAGCQLKPDTAENAFGSVDPSVASIYVLGAVVENRLTDNKNPLSGRLNSNDVQFTDARVRYESPDGSVGGVAEHKVPVN